MAGGCLAVLDVGKTVTKLILLDEAGRRLHRAERVNEPVEVGGLLRLDVAGIEDWLLRELSRLPDKDRIDAIVPVAHGAAAAIVASGKLVTPPIDYEQALPLDLAESYERQRPPFAQTGSPRLPQGLNLGAQFHLLEAVEPGVFAADAQILTWPQYWAWRLCGVAATEVSSLGCHTDLWQPMVGAPSDLCRARGWADRLAPLRRASDELGRLDGSWAEATGLPAATRVICGLHDSNAALLAARGFAEVGEVEATVISTGTWFVAMRSVSEGQVADLAALPEDRDALANVDVAGRVAPSARWMGGRELQRLAEDGGARIDDPANQQALLDALENVVAAGAMIIPPVVPGVGPFPSGAMRWLQKPDAAAERGAAAALYAALMTDAVLDLIGSSRQVVIEGRFHCAEAYARSLAALRPNLEIWTTEGELDLAYGGLRLVSPEVKPPSRLRKVEPDAIDLAGYRLRWRDAISPREGGL